MISYSRDVSLLGADQLDGFFVGWPRSPSPAQLQAVLRRSYCAIVAVDEQSAGIVGFINAISDGVLTAFIPWLEVRPGYQGRGVGSELLRMMLAELDHLYSVDLTCDDGLADFYADRGMVTVTGMGTRRPTVLLGANSTTDDDH